MKKYAVILLAAMMIMLTACGNSSAVETATNTEAGTAMANSEFAVQYPVTITDQAGRKVVIESEPQKIVSGYYISSSMLIALGLEDKIVGIEAKADTRPIYKLSAEQLINLPSVGSAKEFDLEGCVALEPDLVILPMKLKEAATTMEELGINVLLVNPENQILLSEMADIISLATNTVEKKDKLVAYINDQISFLDKTIAEAPANEDIPTQSIYLAGNSSFLSTASSGMYQTELMMLAGGYNVAGEIEDTYWVEVSYEQILAWKPEYIIIAPDANYTVEDVLNDENLSTCRAVKKGRVYQMPSSVEAWDSPVPGGILGAVWLSSILYPDNVTEEDYVNAVKEFYETFYGFSYSEN